MTAATSGTLLRIGFALCSMAIFGLCTGIGIGINEAANNAWRMPTLFIGGAILSAPPLYLFSALTGSDVTLRAIVQRFADVLYALGIALLGLCAPALFLSVTLRTWLARPIALIAIAACGVISVISAAKPFTQDSQPDRLRHIASAWTVFALALGVRLIFVLARAS